MRREKRLAALKRQVQRIERRIERVRKQSDFYSRLRLLTVLGGLAVGIAVYFVLHENTGWAIIVLAFLTYAVEALFHRRVILAQQCHEIWLENKRSQIARMELDWPNIRVPETIPEDEEHPFEADLDVTGQRSLHRLLDISISLEGSRRLRSWLLQVEPDRTTIEYRQGIVRELKPLTRFRDRLYLAFRRVAQEQLDGLVLLEFLNTQRPIPNLTRLLIVAAILIAVNVSLYVLHKLGILPQFWIATLLIYAGFYFSNQGPLDRLMTDTVVMSEELKKFREIFRHLERYPYDGNELLKAHCASFWQAGHRPSGQVRKTIFLSFLVGLRMNPIFRIGLNLVLPWDYACAKLVEGQKEKLLRNLGHWLEAIFELEALLSLANYAYLNPGSAFPSLIDGEPGLDGRDLGHPLLSPAKKVRNTFQMQHLGQIALITGSNMSGKSTFLKTIGLNTVMAYAGGVVDATEFRVSLMRPFSSIQIHDSVTDGFSFFYAEVRRLRKLLDKLDEHDGLPVFFLIDEIFKGTNNRERLIGSRSYIEALSGKNGLGCISTHDLELTHLEEKIAGLSNYHFREEVVKGVMHFDYKLHEGPCPTTNALKIMALEGLPVRE